MIGGFKDTYHVGEEGHPIRPELGTWALWDASASRWICGLSMGTRRGSHATTVLDDDRLLVTGGLSYGSATGYLFVLDPTTGWRAGITLEFTPRSEHAAVRLPGGDVLVIGGRDALHRPMGDIERITLGAAPGPPVEALASLATPRTGHTATVLDSGEVLVAGGWTLDWSILDSVERVGLESPRPAAPLAHARTDHVAVRIDGDVYVVGGRGERGATVAAIERYDADADAWQTVAKLPQPRTDLRAVAVGHRIVVLGGGVGDERGRVVPSSRVDVLDLKTRQWTRAPDLEVARLRHAAVALDDGRIMVTGGQGADGLVLDHVELVTIDSP